MTALDRDTAWRLLDTMCRIRAAEERVGRLKRADEVHGLIHVSVGQEAVAAAVGARLGSADVVYSGHRAHGHAIATGMPLAGLFAELMGRDTGVCRGLGGSMHLVDTGHGMLGATGVVGGNIPLAVGSALASRYSGATAVSVVFFGDGAAQAGHVTEAVNLAALWRLPVLLVCENNGFAEFTPRSAHTVVERVSDAVAPYGLAREVVDGNDAEQVWSAAGTLLENARAGGGPALLECLTHRLRGHYVGDPERYREALSSEEWQRKDPLRRWRDRGIAAGWWHDDDVRQAERDAEREVEAAVETARSGPLPPADLAAELVYAS